MSYRLIVALMDIIDIHRNRAKRRLGPSQVDPDRVCPIWAGTQLEGALDRQFVKALDDVHASLSNLKGFF